MDHPSGLQPSKADGQAKLEEATLTGIILKMRATHIKVVLTPEESEKLNIMLKDASVAGVYASCFT